MALGVAALVLASPLALLNPSAAQQPKPKPLPKATPPAPPGRLLVSVDDECSASVDGKSAGQVTPRQPRVVAVTLGKHIVNCRSVRADVSVEGVVEVGDKRQEVVSLVLRDAVDRALRTPAPRLRTAQAGMFLLVVDPTLGDAARQLSVTWAAEQIDLDVSASPIPSRGLAAGDSVPDHAELTESPTSATTPLKMGEATLQSCSVNLRLTIWRAGQSSTFPIVEAGAALRESDACASARKKASAAAATVLVKSLGKDRR